MQILIAKTGTAESQPEKVRIRNFTNYAELDRENKYAILYQ